MRKPIFLLMAVILAGCTAKTPDKATTASGTTASVDQSADPDQRRVFFGDLHLHTTYSFDAWSLMGTKTTPDEAYKFARGETVQFMGKPVKRAWPLDFTAVTDHSENMGVMNQLDDGSTAFAQSDLGKQILKDPVSRLLYPQARGRHQDANFRNERQGGDDGDLGSGNSGGQWQL